MTDAVKRSAPMIQAKGDGKMFRTIAFAAATLAAPLALSAPAQAQNTAQGGVLVIYGNDKCPTNNAGEEIVVCQRLDESERFRIPQVLREQSGPPQQTESWAVRSQAALATGRTGTGSCSAVGPGGSTGCLAPQIRAGKAEARARANAQNDLPLP
jgi:hypothetical protein